MYHPHQNPAGFCPTTACGVNKMDKAFEKILLGLAGLLGLSLLLKKKEAPPSVVVSPVARAEKEQTTREKLLSIAMRESGLPQEELVTRGLIPSDFGLSYWGFDLTANMWNTLVSTSVPDQTWVSIDGLSYAGDSVTELKVTAGGAVKEIWNVQFVSVLENKMWLDPTPTIVKQNQMLSISAYSKNTTSGDSIALLGTVVQKVGIVTA